MIDINIQEIENIFIEAGDYLDNIELEMNDRPEEKGAKYLKRNDRDCMDERNAFQALGEQILDIFSSDDPDYYIEEYWTELLDLRIRLERPIEEYECEDNNCLNYHRNINSAIGDLFERLGLKRLSEILNEKELLRNALATLELGRSMQMDWAEIVYLTLEDEEESMQLNELQKTSSKICLERGAALDHLIDYIYYDEVNPNEETKKYLKVVNEWLKCQGEKIPENMLEFSQHLRGLSGLYESDEEELEIIKAINIVLEEIKRREES